MGIRIDGRAIADNIIDDLTRRTAILKKNGVLPTLAVILVGHDPGSLAYIRQKQKIGEKIGARFMLKKLDNNTASDSIIALVNKYNIDKTIHGIIVQIPLPPDFDAYTIVQKIKTSKDVDGFKAESPFTQPVAAAILKILTVVYKEHSDKNMDFSSWLTSQSICVLGRGQTAGKPIADLLLKRGVALTVIHSQTKEPQTILKKSDIIISCVGKPNVISAKDIKKSAIVIGVGLHMEDGKLRGDFNEEDIAAKASFYSPTPGGVGPINVACLWENVVTAAENGYTV